MGTNWRGVVGCILRHIRPWFCWPDFSRFSVRARLLVPLTVLIVMMFTACGVVLYCSKRLEIAEESQQAFDKAWGAMQWLEREEVDKIQAMLDGICSNPLLVQAFVEQDRQGLLAEAEPLYRQLNRSVGISHFYFHDPQRVCWLRVHQPQRFGDRIDRLTAVKAQQSRRTVWGWELGPLGTYTLRVVRPWFDQDRRLLGFVEMGKEVQPFIQQLQQMQSVDCLVGIDRRYVDRGRWVEGRRAMGLDSQWRVLGSMVVAATSRADLPVEALAGATLGREEAESGGRTVRVGRAYYRCSVRPLVDATGRCVGRWVLVRDVSGGMAVLDATMGKVAAWLGGLGLVALGMTWWMLGQVDRRLRRQAESLQASEQRLSTMLQASKDAIVVIDEQGRVILFNPAAERLFGYKAEQMLGGDLKPILPDPEKERHGQRVAGFFREGKPNGAIGKTVELTAMTAEGRAVPVELSLSYGCGGGQRFVLGIIRDITARRAAQEKLQRANERFELAVRGSQEGLWDWDMRTGRVYYSPQWKRQLGWAEQEISDRPEEWFKRIVSSQLNQFNDTLQSILSGQTDQFDMELMMSHRDGGTRWMLCRAVAVRDEQGQVVRLAGSMSDITAIKQAEHQLRRLARQDPLTGLANRPVFCEAVQRAIDRLGRRPDRSFAVLFFDFDRFKQINDGLGHATGDALLRSIADIFRALSRSTDCVARLGGDEFAMLLDDVESIDDARSCAQRLLEAFRKPHRLGQHEVFSTASIGIAFSDPTYRTADQMLRDADVALYAAKQAGRDCIRLFNAEMRTWLDQRLALEQDLRHAVRRGQLQLYYQPIIHLESGRLVGFEALLRWQHPERGLIMPDQFIGIAEETGLIVPIGQWLLQEACEQLVRWDRQFGAGHRLSMAVNVSRRQLLHPELCEHVMAALARSGLSPDRLHLEITETFMVDQRDHLLERMKQLRELGVQLAMDDFGTGYSSLSCLNHFPIQILKIDRDFIVNMTRRVEFAAVVHAIVTLAQHLGLTIVAEGLEDSDQVAQLQALNCDYGQGYFFARPMPAEQATGFIAEHLAGASAAPVG